MSNITEITPYKIGSHMIIDNFTRRNLELIETMRDKEKRGSLCFVLDKTKTAMGGRLIRKFITEHKKEINKEKKGRLFQN